MPTVVADLMSTPAVTCEAGTPLDEAARTMRDAGIGSVIVTERGKVTGIVTERDLLRAAAAATTAGAETVEMWMTANPDVLGPEEEVDAAWTSLAHHQYRHLPVVDGHDLVGVVSLRDLMGVAPPAPRGRARRGDPRRPRRRRGGGDLGGRRPGRGGLLPLPPVLCRRPRGAAIARRRLVPAVRGRAPRPRPGAPVRGGRGGPPGPSARVGGVVAGRGGPGHPVRGPAHRGLAPRRRAGWRPTHDIDDAELRSQALRLCSVVPTIMAAAYNLGEGRTPVEPRPDLSAAANYLWMVTGSEPSPAHARAVEQYQILTIDHGFNASTFTARVITSTGADLAAAICGAVGALSGPLHGGAPSRALAMLDDIASAERADAWLRAAVDRGDRVMGFGHRVYKTDDPARCSSRRGPLTGWPAGGARRAGRADRRRRPGRDEARAPALHQRRVLRRRRDVHLRPAAPDVHAHLRGGTRRSGGRRT